MHNANDVEDSEEDYEESMSMYEEEELDEEDDLHPTMSFEEDIEELQSYRNHNGQGPSEGPGNTDFLNESTADFNKEIRQIHQELKDEFGNDLI